jgi:hypothetical protein
MPQFMANETISHKDKIFFLALCVTHPVLTFSGIRELGPFGPFG